MSRSSERIGAWIIWWSDAQWPRPLPWIGGALALFFAAGILLPVNVCGPVSARNTQAKSDVVLLLSALRAYQTDHGESLTGSNAAIVRALLGDNARKTVYLEVRQRQLNLTGEIIDPWGSPYRFDFSDPEQPRIHSPGKNKCDELDARGSDDICSWR